MLGLCVTQSLAIGWLALIDGEGSFYITHDRTGYTYRPRFALTVRADDLPALKAAQNYADIGTIHQYRAQSGSLVARWNVQSHSDCSALVELLTTFPLRAKKRYDFEIWKKAVTVAQQIRPGRANNAAVRSALEKLKDNLSTERANRKAEHAS